jgi:transcriptional regulator with XRE-family HTH domain
LLREYIARAFKQSEWAMTITKRRSPELHPMDMHIGRQMRLRRQILVLSQMDLAARLNISYQQLQKYETGRNRISASRLYQTAQCLGVPVGYFFEGADALSSKTATGDGPGEPGDMDANAIKTLAAFSQIANPLVRNSLVQLARAIGQSSDAADDGT